MSDGFASLTSGLLARKGHARPAMRPQGYDQIQNQSDDLGWNDMGEDARRPLGVRLPTHLSGPHMTQPDREAESLSLTVASILPEEAVVESAAIHEPSHDAGGCADDRSATIHGAAMESSPGQRKAAFTLRLDTDRHLKLRLACAVQNRSAQQILIQALDTLLDKMPAVDRLVATLPVVKN